MKTAALMKLTELFLTALSKDETIKAWCKEKYNRQPWFIVGMDYNKPPNEEECPYIVIAPNRKEEGHVNELRYVVNIAWCVKNSDISNNDNTTKFTGLYEADELGELIIKIASKALQESHIETIGYTIDGILQYPQFPGEAELLISVPYTIGNTEIEF